MIKLKESKLQKLNRLKSDCQNCFECGLLETRTNVVFSDGNPESARIVLIGEAPGENEDLKGIPFVGRAGKLLDEFIDKSGLSRANDFYIINTVKCRPPKNRVPSHAEKAACEHFMLEQIKIIDPEIILFCGATALKSFSDGTKFAKMPISKIRGEVFKVEVDSKKYKAMAIFHPSYLLRNHSIEENSPRDLMLKDLKKVKGLI